MFFKSFTTIKDTVFFFKQRLSINADIDCSNISTYRTI